jgi:hypothetical protein
MLTTISLPPPSDSEPYAATKKNVLHGTQKREKGKCQEKGEEERNEPVEVA